MNSPLPRPPGLPAVMVHPEEVWWIVTTFDCPLSHAPRGEPCRPADPADPYAEVCVARVLRALRNDLQAYHRRQEKEAARIQRAARAHAERSRKR